MTDEELTSYWNAYRRTVDHAPLYDEEKATLQDSFASVFNECRRAREAEELLRAADVTGAEWLVQEERSACAAIADYWAGDRSCCTRAAGMLAAAIRARGQDSAGERDERDEPPRRCEWGLVCSSIDPHRHWLARCLGCRGMIDAVLHEGPLHPEAAADSVGTKLMEWTSARCDSCCARGSK